MRARRGLGAAASFLFAVQALTMLVGSETAMGPLLLDFIPIAIPVFAAAASFATATHRPEERAFWNLLGAGAFAWALGDIAYSVYDQIGYDPATALSFADAGYLAVIPLWGAALIAHPSRSRRALDRMGVAIDGVALFAFVATIAAAYVLIPSLIGAEDLGGAIVNVVYPVGDLVLVAILVSTLARSEGRTATGDILVVLAASVFAVGDLVYARIALNDSYDVGHPVDLAWSAAFVLLALASTRDLSAPSRQRSAFPVLSACAVGGVAILSILAVTTHLHETRLPPAERFVSRPILVGAVLTAFVVLARLILLIVDRARLIKTLDANIEALEEAQEARERFAATMAHDLRSPLTSICGFAQLIQEPGIIDDVEQVRMMAGSIERNGHHLARLTEDLLCAGQFAAGHPPNLELVAVDLRQTADEVVHDLDRADEVAVIGEAGTFALADAQRLRQILTNLIDNATKHGKASQIEARVDRIDGRPSIEVRDNGVGIPADKVDRIFDPFVSGSNKASSIGLGLYVVSSLVEAMDGELAVESEVGVGTTFRVTLPAAEPGEAERSAA